MEQDSLILNFNSSPAETAPARLSKKELARQTSSGEGRMNWKQKREAVKVTYKQISKDHRANNPIPENESIVPIKDVVQQTPTPTVSRHFIKTSTTVKKLNSSTTTTSTSIASSLFTSNPDRPVASLVPNSTVTAPALFNPEASFSELGINPILIAHLKDKLEIDTPTNIQRKSIPFLSMNSPGTDLIIKAQTGSGKTLAFLLPIVNRLMEAELECKRMNRARGMFAMILTPTRYKLSPLRF